MRIHVFLFCLFVFTDTLFSQDHLAGIEEALFNLPDVQFKMIEKHVDHQKVELKIRQPLDHDHPEKGYFHQKVVLIHRGYDRPVVMNTNGYSMSSTVPEIVTMLGANLLNIEHRYFGDSRPDSLDWQYLNLKQVTADLHHINQLFKDIYKYKWVSTGISKGGQTTIYYRYFYPADVDLSIPYVAPVNQSTSDPRIYEFLDTVGPDDCRKRVFDIQESLLVHKEWMLDHLYWYVTGKEYTFEYVGGLEAAYELAVLEYPFSFWQSGSDCNVLPDIKDKVSLLHHFLEAVGLSLYDDELIEFFAPHYYQAATEMGYYTLRTDGLEQYIDEVGDNPSAAFTPVDAATEYDPTTNNGVHTWLKSIKEDMVFIYGEYDTWSATRAVTPQSDNVLYLMVDDEDHGGARMKNLSEYQWMSLVEFMKKRHGLVLSHQPAQK